MNRLGEEARVDVFVTTGTAVTIKTIRETFTCVTGEFRVVDITCTVTITAVVTVSCGLGDYTGVVEDRIGVTVTGETVIGTVDIVAEGTYGCVVLAVV